MKNAASAIVLGVAVAFIALTATLSTNFDFRAFYCAGAAINAHANPYRVEPLRTCEQLETDKTFSQFARETVLPAPQPGYDLVAFAMLAKLPFAVAAKIWSVCLLACSLGTVLLVRRLTDAHPIGVLAAFWLSLCITSIYLGELVPLCIVALAAAAIFAQSGRWHLAGVAAGLTLVEPHIGVPIVASVALWESRARVSLLLCVAALAGISVATLGIPQNFEYVTRVLPLHAAAEIGSDAQLSASVILHAIGFPGAVALRIGFVSFLLAGALGAWIGGNLARRFDDRAFVVAAPAAFAVMGGTFIHVTDMTAALPLVLLLLRYSAAGRSLLIASLVLLAVPWWSLATPMLLGSFAGFGLAAATAMFLLWIYAEKPLYALVGGLATFAFAAGAVHWYAVTAKAVPVAHAAFVLDPLYPQATWAAANIRYLSSGVAAAWLLRVPTWCALLILGAVAITFLSPLRRPLKEA